MIRAAAIALLLSGAALAPAAAQTTRSLPAELRNGRRALSFGAFVDGGGMIGLTYMMSARTAFTLDVQGDMSINAIERRVDDVVTEERDDFAAEVLLAPGFRRYMAGRGDVASYLAGRLLLGFDGYIQDDGDSRVERWRPAVGGALGFGLEWFITDAMSVRGEAAVEATYSRATTTASATDETIFEGIHAGLGQSGLGISIWF